MRPEESLARGESFLGEAIENLTFAEFEWALEEAWRGIAWALEALRATPRDDIALGPKGAVPPTGTLTAHLDATPEAPRAARSVVAQLEALRRDLDAGVELDEAKVERCVFEAWEVYNACARDLAERGYEVAEIPPEGTPRGGLKRRAALKLLLTGAGGLPLAACSRPEPPKRATSKEPTSSRKEQEGEARAARALEHVEVDRVTPLRAMQWPTSDPFLFCAHHRDDYPTGNASFGPDTSLAGRHLGRDFDPDKDWRMYHGRAVPGFPRHPHRGFETVTVVREGMLDHSDSMGAAARYGAGDVQWLTAGGGIQHFEMFPLLRQNEPNPLELFQIWLNLPRADKMVDPHFTMLWSERIPRVTLTDEAGHTTELTLIAGAHQGHGPPSPPPDSWASRPESDLAIWTLRMDPGARLELPAVAEGTVRSLYVHRGKRRPHRRARPGEPAPRRDRAARPGAHSGRAGRGRDPAAAGSAHRRAGGQARAVRDEHPGRDPAGIRRLSAHSIRRLAVGGWRAGASRRKGPVCAAY